MNADVVGVINAGSSSLKFPLHEGDAMLLAAQVDGIGVRGGLKARAGAVLAVPDSPIRAPVCDALRWLGAALSCTSHRRTRNR